MKQLGLKSVIRVKRKYFEKSDGLFTYNKLNREFTSELPKNKLVTDVTYLKVKNTNYYLSVVLDLFNNEVLSYQLSRFNDTLLVIDSLYPILPIINGAIIHSDQGHQYTSITYTHILEQNNINKSMSRRGNCLDNACIESFFGHLKSESIYLTKINSYEELQNLIDEYIYFYNNERLQSRLNRMTPTEYRRHYENQKAFL